MSRGRRGTTKSKLLGCVWCKDYKANKLRKYVNWCWNAAMSPKSERRPSRCDLDEGWSVSLLRTHLAPVLAEQFHNLKYPGRCFYKWLGQNVWFEALYQQNYWKLVIGHVTRPVIESIGTALYIFSGVSENRTQDFAYCLWCPNLCLCSWTSPYSSQIGCTVCQVGTTICWRLDAVLVVC